jgi:hypothetical protein
MARFTSFMLNPAKAERGEGTDTRPRRRVVQRLMARYAPRRHEILECGHRVTVRPSDPLARTRRCDGCAPKSD